MALFELKTITELTLKEIDDITEEIALCGYEGLILPRDGDWEVLKGFCRSADRHSLKLWLRDDTDDPSGSFGGEVTSVPSFISEKPGLWGCAPYDPEAAEAFMDCSYREIKRELGRFMGYELAGIVTRFGEADEDFARTHLDPITQFCEKNGLELIAQTDFPQSFVNAKTAFADFGEAGFAQRQRGLCALLAKGAKRIAVHADLYPDYMEAVWCANGDRLLQWLQGEPEPIELGVPAVRFSGGAYLLYNDGDEDMEISLDLDALGAKCIADSFTGGVYLPPSAKLPLTLKAGGSLVLLAEDEAQEPLPDILSCGAVFGEPVKTGEAEFSLLRSGGHMAYRAELPEDCGGKYIRLDGGFSCAAVKIGRRMERLLLPPFALPLYSVDEGRSAEIVVFPRNGQKSVSFGISNVNIVDVKNHDI